MKASSFIVNGYTEEYCKNGFVAVSIELGLATQGDPNEQNREEMVNRLEYLAFDYINSSFETPKYTNQLLSRKACMSQRFKYYLIKLLEFIKLNTFFMKKYKTFQLSFSVITS